MVAMRRRPRSHVTLPNAEQGEQDRPRSVDMAALLTVSELASYLHIHPKSIYALAARGGLPCVRIGARLRFDSRDIDRWLSARKEG